MQKIVIFGNSGSGKSTLAREYACQHGLSHLDLDTLAWEDTNPPSRKSLQTSAAAIKHFVESNQSWVIEGCYSDLLDLVMKDADEIFFLNPGTETCIRNCQSRPWEPHKYASIDEQNKNLDMLLDWIKQYPSRDDEFSLKSHQKLFNDFNGKKRQYTSNERI